MAIIRKKVILVIPEDMLLEPILNTINQQYEVKINLYNSDITEDEDLMRLEIEGEEKQIEEGLAWIMAKGIRVELI